jgi:hypothetical protein
MQKWEYCAIRADLRGEVKKLKFLSSGPDSEIQDIADVHMTMASLGEQGWEMISLIQISEPDARVYYFKRPAA